MNSVVTSLQSTVAGKQDKLTFDSTPTNGSNNPVTSGGIYNAINNKQDKLTFDSTPTSGSSNPVTSDGIYQAIQIATNKLEGSIQLGRLKVTSYTTSGAWYHFDAKPTPSALRFTSEGRVTITFDGASASSYPSFSRMNASQTMWLPEIAMSYNLTGSGTITIQSPYLYMVGTVYDTIISKDTSLKLIIHVSDGVVQNTDINFGFSTKSDKPSASDEYVLCNPLTVTIT